MTQPTLPGLAPPPKLTPRMQYCLDYIRRNPEVTATQIGAAWRVHGQGTWRFSHASYDHSNGNGIGESLRKRGLVKRVNIDGQRGYRAVNTDGKPWQAPTGPEPECCDEYPFCRCNA